MIALKTTLAGAVGTALIAACVLALAPGLNAADAPTGNPEAGKEIANDRKLGNCMACHVMPDIESPGNIGPPLIGMQARYPDKEKLRAQIWDATVANPDSSMPPFGKHGILTEQQLNDVLEYIWSL
ncbi:sulfur oxidation c-type cytochrome SoxX [Candidatus Thiosymbion oneisti]|uniref:sulfur oxidation c-type cytochrome SoxX n=1 Tax=Candidatus Thiosymbion oneisti TaxID=589554 RepID=UPI000B2CFD1D|nr:sulfur oxidation c-type cytochrome SoxX [Candidatus Thiosymbion oneisti]